MTRGLLLSNRRRGWAVDLRLLRRITVCVLEEQLGLAHYELGVRLVDKREIAQINGQFLRHAGPTDVISFAYDEGGAEPGLRGDLCICLDEAAENAARFRTTWQAELVRYIIHGLLHLRGFDDLKPEDRRRMKRRENCLLRRILLRFPVGRLGGNPEP